MRLLHYSTAMATIIYIPIWLDLLLACNNQKIAQLFNLHSNMVRFIIWWKSIQIQFIPNLHSNMVRFIMLIHLYLQAHYFLFTFQYG